MVFPFQIEEICPDVTGRSMRLPRSQGGSSPQGLAVTLMADYTLRNEAWLPATALLTLLGEFGVTPAAARVAISRLVRRGVLTSRRHGQFSSYQLTGQAAAELSGGGIWVAGFAAEPESWDGLWTFVTFSMPKEETTQRNALRVHLRWRGFAPLYDGVWVSPRPLPPAELADLAPVASGAITVIRARHVPLDTEADRSPVTAWDLEAIAEHYETCGRSRPRAAATRGWTSRRTPSPTSTPASGRLREGPTRSLSDRHGWRPAGRAFADNPTPSPPAGGVRSATPRGQPSRSASAGGVRSDASGPPGRRRMGPKR